MAEGLAVAASIIAVVQLGDRVLSLCCQLMGKVRGAEREVRETIETVTALKGLLEFLEIFTKIPENEPRVPQLRALCRSQGPLDICKTRLEDMERKLQPPKRDYKGVLNVVTWIWKWKDLEEALAVIEKQKTLISLAIHGDTAETTLRIEGEVSQINHRLRDQSRKDVLQWLSKTNPTSNHMAACSKHEPGTGEWFTSSREFTYWLLPRRSLWLHGKPGAGKTVLCSTIIEHMKMRSPPGSVCLYYYFDFNDPQKQNPTNMLYSLLAQLSESIIPLEVQHLYITCRNGTQESTITQLVDTLLSLTKRGSSIYIILDALDESRPLKELLQIIKTIIQSESEINMLVTSRREYEIGTWFQDLMNFKIAIEDQRVDMDINTHVRQCLKNDSILREWDEDLKLTITTTLTSKAHGM